MLIGTYKFLLLEIIINIWFLLFLFSLHAFEACELNSVLFLSPPKSPEKGFINSSFRHETKGKNFFNLTCWKCLNGCERGRLRMTMANDESSFDVESCWSVDWFKATRNFIKQHSALYYFLSSLFIHPSPPHNALSFTLSLNDNVENEKSTFDIPKLNKLWSKEKSF